MTTGPDVPKACPAGLMGDARKQRFATGAFRWHNASLS